MSYMHGTSMRHASLVGALIVLAASSSVPRTVMQAANAVTRAARADSPARSKLRNTRTTVAAMKRQARKRRNVRARSAK